MKCLKRFLLDEDGPTAVEYAVMLAMIVMLALTAIVGLGNATNESWQSSSQQLEAVFGS